MGIFMKRYIFSLFVMALFSVPSSCLFDNSNDNSDINSEKGFVYTVMKDDYLWYDRVPDVDYRSYASPEDLLDALMYKELDRWSFIMSASDAESYFDEGEILAYGFTMRWNVEDGSDVLRIYYVYENSSAHEKGLKRGDRILKLNDIPAADIEQQDSWDTVLGESREGVTIDITVEDGSGTVKTETLTKTVFTINTVLYSDVIDTGDLKIGYFVFSSFIGTSYEELDGIFQTFRTEDIDALVIDLSLNSGGRFDVAVYLAGLIAGSQFEDDIFVKKKYNDRNQKRNITYYFSRDDNSLEGLFDNSAGTGTVVFITGDQTASASELLISGLDPYFDVKLVGGDTYGKPVGMDGLYFPDGTKIFFPVTFITENADASSGYFDGLPCDRQVDDTAVLDWGDASDAFINEAVHYITTGEFTAADSAAVRRLKRLDAVHHPKRIRAGGLSGLTGIY